MIINIYFHSPFYIIKLVIDIFHFLDDLESWDFLFIDFILGSLVSFLRVIKVWQELQAKVD